MGTQKGRKQKSCEQDTVQRQDPTSHPHRRHLGLQLPGSGTHPSTHLLRTLTSTTGGKCSIPGKPVLDFTGCNIQKSPTSLHSACRGPTSASESALAATIQPPGYRSPPGASTSVQPPTDAGLGSRPSTSCCNASEPLPSPLRCTPTSAGRNPPRGLAFILLKPKEEEAALPHARC